jgi:hypothetical protein
MGQVWWWTIFKVTFIIYLGNSDFPDDWLVLKMTSTNREKALLTKTPLAADDRNAEEKREGTEGKAPTRGKDPRSPPLTQGGSETRFAKTPTPAKTGAGS